MKSGGQHDGRIFGDKLIRGLYDDRMPRQDNYLTQLPAAAAASATAGIWVDRARLDHDTLRTMDKIKYIPPAVAAFITNSAAAFLTTRGQVGKDVLRRPSSGCDRSGCDRTNNQIRDRVVLPFTIFAAATAAAKVAYDITCSVITTGAAAAFSLVPASALNPYGIQEGQEI